MPRTRILMLVGLYGTIAVLVAVFVAKVTQAHFGTDTARTTTVTASQMVLPRPSTPGPSATRTRSGTVTKPGTSLGPRSAPATRTSRPKPASVPRAGSVPRAAASVNLAAGRPVTVSSHVENYVAAQVTDGDQGTYWESAPSFPQRVRVDLGSVTTVGRLRLMLPSSTDWNRRVQTLSVYGSRDGKTFTRLRAPAGYTFDANAGSADTVSVALSASAQRYLELRFSANDGWKAAQLSELQVHSS